MIIYTWVDEDGGQRWSKRRPTLDVDQVSDLGGVYRLAGRVVYCWRDFLTGCYVDSPGQGLQWVYDPGMRHVWEKQ